MGEKGERGSAVVVIFLALAPVLRVHEKKGNHMRSYDAPSLTELGSVADMTQADQLAVAFDGHIFHKDVRT